MSPKVISLFTGCGGFDLGLKNNGAETIFACDIFKEALDTYSTNFNTEEILLKDIRMISSFPDADIIIGGYPCQGFSLAGKRLLDDPRNALYKEFVRALSLVKPKFFIAENVKGLLTFNNGSAIREMVRDFEEQGYVVNYQLYNAKYMGVPQDRERVFIVGVRNDIDFTYSFPEETHGTDKEPLVTLREAIGDLSLDPIGDYPTYGFSSRFLSRNRKREWNEVSFCIQASGRHAPIHPAGEPMLKLGKDEWVFQGEVNRRISYREAARIQTFPDNFVFSGNLENKYKQIGNAVPPLLAEKISKPIVDYFKS